MAAAKAGDRVSVHYTGSLDDGTVFDSSRDKAPLAFTLGAGEVIAGFDTAVDGMQIGEVRRTVIPAEKAYGDYNEELLFAVANEQLPVGLEAEIGEQYQMRQPDGQLIIVTVRDVSAEGVVFDANHPLAGQDLSFEIELMSIN
jgi:peptidylprolyl isomerase